MQYLEGQCLCGAVKVTATAADEPKLRACNCVMCRRHNSAAFVTVEVDQADSRPGWWRRAIAAVVAGLGWLLSPLSWWNDLVVNVPLAYLFSLPFSLIDERFYVPAFALGYWLTNVLGFVLLHKGVTGMISTRRTSLKHDLLIATAYTVVVVIVASLGWLPSPATLLEQWRAR